MGVIGATGAVGVVGGVALQAGSALIVIDRLPGAGGAGVVAVNGGELESSTVAVNGKFPALVGVPVIAPAEARLKPGGNVPEADRVYGFVPPIASALKSAV
jgi:hypothetical protein